MQCASSVRYSPTYLMAVNALICNLLNLKKVFHYIHQGKNFVELAEGAGKSSLYRWDAEEQGFVYCGEPVRED